MDEWKPTPADRLLTTYRYDRMRQAWEAVNYGDIKRGDIFKSCYRGHVDWSSSRENPIDADDLCPVLADEDDGHVWIADEDAHRNLITNEGYGCISWKADSLEDALNWNDS